jgi:hypothetical protein
MKQYITVCYHKYLMRPPTIRVSIIEHTQHVGDILYFVSHQQYL